MLNKEENTKAFLKPKYLKKVNKQTKYQMYIT